MTFFGTSISSELRSALVPVETVSIVDYKYLASTIRALINNALFYVVPTPAITNAREIALAKAERLAHYIHAVGVQPQGISLAVDQARTDAIVALQDLIDAVANAGPRRPAAASGS